ncbi:MAG: hypothetical protein IT439_11425 [Phycisphaerales bacterium]|nr:hypothetical protein [Phycisphaerales bacterium]
MMHLGLGGERFGVDAFAAHIADSGTISRSVSGTVAWAAVSAEVVGGLWLLSHCRPRLGAAFAIGLLACFSAFLVAAATRPDGACPCFGARAAARAPWPFIRNGILILALVPSLLRRVAHRSRGEVHRAAFLP